MNYIKHLTGFFEKVVSDNSLNPTHISLYIALFQSWNCNRFRNPISISRDEIMRISKISSKATYHKCLKNLHLMGYIKYEPSYNPFKGSHVYLFNFSEDLKPILKKDKNQSSFFDLVSKQVINKQDTAIQPSTKQALVPYINNTNNLNNEKESKGNPSLNSENNNSHQEKIEMNFNFENNEMKKEKSSAKKEKEFSSAGDNSQGASNLSDFIKPHFIEVFDHFMEHEFEIKEAQKFFNYYESNGWLVGGKTIMVDWKAAAYSWMSKTEIFKNKPNTVSTNQNRLNSPTDKDYSEPL